MADFDHITVNGTTKYAKDSTARAGLADKVDKVEDMDCLRKTSRLR